MIGNINTLLSSRSNNSALDKYSPDSKAVFSCQAVSGPDDGKVELLSKVAERFDISIYLRKEDITDRRKQDTNNDFSKLSAATNFTL